MRTLRIPLQYSKEKHVCVCTFQVNINYLSKKGLKLDQASSTNIGSRKSTYIVGCQGALQLGGPFQGYPPRV